MPVPLTRRPIASSALRWVAAALAAVLAVVVRALLQPALGDDLPFVIAAPVAIFCALMWGAGPGALATVVCLVGALLPGIPPDVLNRDSAVRAFYFGVAMTVACVVVARVDSTRRNFQVSGPASATPLVRWLNAALLGAVLVPATAFVVIGWWSYERASHASRQTAVRRADLVHEHARRTFEVGQRLIGEAAALTTKTDDVIRARENDARQRLSDMLLSVPSVVNLNVWTRDGVPLVRSDRAIDPTATVLDRDYFKRQAAADIGFDVSDVLVGRQTGRELFNLTRRRPSADGTFTGILALSMNPEYFREYYRAIVAQNEELESIALVRTDGLYLARWPLPPAGMKRLPAGAPSLAAVQQGAASGVVFGPLPATGERRIAAFRRLEGLPLYVVVSFSESALMATWVRTMGMVGAMALPITLMLIGLTVIARRRVLSEQRAQLELHEQIQLRAATEKNALEAHRRQTVAALTAGVAHDFNNLLAIISNSLHVQNVRHPTFASEPQIAAMRRAVASGTRLTRQLLSLTRRQALRPEVIHLQAWLPELHELLRTTLGSRIQLAITVAPDVAPVLLDEAELELALVNLAVNARHAQPHGGAFTVTAEDIVEDATRWVVIRAEDRGEGIPQELLARVVEPFFTTKDPGSGSGLGLNQVRVAMEAAGGALQIDSEVGQGTTVTLRLPAYEARDKPAIQEPTHKALPANKFEGHVLVVEDNDDVAGVTVALINSMGLQVTRAASAAEALRVLRTPVVGERVRFVLTDVVMPGAMDGVALALQLRSERPDLPVTVITGFAENEQLAIDGRLDMLRKPLEFNELLARLRKAFPAG